MPMEKMDYWKKDLFPKEYQNLEWNIPEQKTGTISIVGGNSQNFSSIIKSAEFLQQTYPINTLKIILPDSLKTKLPPLETAIFTPSTSSGSFDKSPLLSDSLKNTDFNILLGDFSKNSATTIAISDAIKSSTSKILLARDTIDLLGPEMANIVDREEGLFIIGSMIQLQKMFRAIYYPKVLLLSMPIMQAVEALHKFTLSYPVTIFTFHQEKIIIANAGEVATVPISSTPYTPISIWSGNIACKIAMMNLYTPGKPLEATIAALS
ncbi:hypothetical protein IJH16_02730 [Candidatus Saccharibacteria bacterium]|nr:hypothetical protein [Candidatus Saccharibacteria bacterium]